MDETQRGTVEGQNIERNIKLSFQISGMKELEEAGKYIEG